MEIRVLSEDYEALGLLEPYESLVWNDRFQGYGDFEAKVPATPERLALLTANRYLWRNDSEHVMIIEKVRIETDRENGDHIIVSGRSLESILERRVIQEQISVDGKLQNGVQKLLNACIISPSAEARKIANFQFAASTDTAVTTPTLETNFKGDNLYDIVQAGCQVNSLGFKVTLSEKNLVFQLYAGKDRSFSQAVNPFVIFSQGFDNMLSSNYEESLEGYKNLCYALGAVASGDTTESKLTTAYRGKTEPSGLQRREVYTEVSGDFETESQLKERGLETLEDNAATKCFEAEVDTNIMFRYGKDFFLGDIVQVENEYGMQARARVTEVITTHDPSGFSCYPTFTFLE